MSNIWNTILEKREVPEYDKYHSDEIDKKDDYSKLLLSEFGKRNIALQIYSEYLSCEVWLCSNTGMQKQIKNDDPKAITYTVDELRHLIKLNPNPDELRGIHYAKEIFHKSKIINSVLRNKS